MSASPPVEARALVRQHHPVPVAVHVLCRSCPRRARCSASERPERSRSPHQRCVAAAARLPRCAHRVRWRSVGDSRGPAPRALWAKPAERARALGAACRTPRAASAARVLGARGRREPRDGPTRRDLGLQLACRAVLATRRAVLASYEYHCVRSATVTQAQTNRASEAGY